MSLTTQQIVDLQTLTNREFGERYSCHPSFATMLRKRHQIPPARVDNSLPTKTLGGTVSLVQRLGLRPAARVMGVCVSTVQYRLEQYERRRKEDRR